MATRIIVLFNLKPEVSTSDYEAWAKQTDLPTVNGLTSVADFTVWKSTGLLGSEEKPPYQYIEILDVADMDQFGPDTATQAMTKIASEFQAMAADLSFIMTEKLGYSWDDLQAKPLLSLGPDADWDWARRSQ